MLSYSVLVNLEPESGFCIAMMSPLVAGIAPTDGAQIQRPAGSRAIFKTLLPISPIFTAQHLLIYSFTDFTSLSCRANTRLSNTNRRRSHVTVITPEKTSR